MHCLFYRIQRRWTVLVELIPQGRPAGRTPALVAALPLILIEDTSGRSLRFGTRVTRFQCRTASGTDFSNFRNGHIERVERNGHHAVETDEI